ncbi:MAG: hypothetical protein M3R71_04460 [Actinomycetota bacterium]|nr:hypothetical protein [Actinomycetota bacterium]
MTARARVVIQKALAASHQVQTAETSRPGHASRLAQGAAADGVDVVVVLGGDGTLNEAANGLVGTSTALGVLPGGSTNVFARTIGMTNDPIAATTELLASIAAGGIERVNLGSVNGRYFLFHVGIGYDAAVVRQVERRGILKRTFGHAVFVAAAILTWYRHYDRRHPSFAVAGDAMEHGAGADVADGYFGICLNTNPYTFLGNRPLDVATGTGFDNGLTMITFRTLQLAALLPLAVEAWRGGEGLATNRSVQVARDQRQVVVTGYKPVPYQMDGEYLGELDRIVIRNEVGALRLVLPRHVPGVTAER